MKIKRGVYVSQEVTKQQAISLIDETAYISGITVLGEYGILSSQDHIFCITQKSRRVIKNDLGEFHLHHLSEKNIFGLVKGIPQANLEKALCDYFYFSEYRIQKNIILSFQRKNFTTQEIQKIFGWFESERLRNLHLLDFQRAKKYALQMNEKTYVLVGLLEYYFFSRGVV